jgi:2-polyprenyl-3-methyl-5-hydroxy-6-metoxy-1,4-benzoquinol methylase
MIGRFRSLAMSKYFRARRGIEARLVPISVDDHMIEFAVDQNSSDPIANALAEQSFPEDAVNKLWRHLVRARNNVLDVGAHLGMYALPAAAVGAYVIAVEASPTNAALLGLAAQRNSFTNLTI